MQDDFRCDGRSRLDYRPIVLETGLVSNASGSARLRLANSDILVGIKVELDVPVPEKPDEGRLEFFVDWYVICFYLLSELIYLVMFLSSSANATPEFEGRGGEELANQIAKFMQRCYSSSDTLNLSDLCVLPKVQCWILYIDILVKNIFHITS